MNTLVTTHCKFIEIMTTATLNEWPAVNTTELAAAYNPQTHPGEMMRVLNSPHNTRSGAGRVNQYMCHIRVALGINLSTDMCMYDIH